MSPTPLAALAAVLAFAAVPARAVVQNTVTTLKDRVRPRREHLLQRCRSIAGHRRRPSHCQVDERLLYESNAAGFRSVIRIVAANAFKGTVGIPDGTVDVRSRQMRHARGFALAPEGSFRDTTDVPPQNSGGCCVSRRRGLSVAS
jgi:hypothetical protein